MKHKKILFWALAFFAFCLSSLGESISSLSEVFFYEVNPMTCPQCQGEMRVIAFITDYAVVDRIINHLKLTFVAERPPPRTWSIRNS